MAAKKKKPEAPKRPKAGGLTADNPLTYARIPVNMRKTDYDMLIEYEKEHDIFNHATIVRQFVLERLKAWKESKNKKASD
jgi:hypothetical protein